MNPSNLLAALTLVVLALLTWQLRWVLLVLFGAVVLAVALGSESWITVRIRIPLPPPSGLPRKGGGGVLQYSASRVRV